MNSFDPSKPGYLYFLENPSIRVKKVGITNNLSSVHRRYGSKWIINSFIFSEDGRVIKRSEQVVLQAIRSRQKSRNLLTKSDLRQGFTETFSADVSNNTVKRLIRRSFKQSMGIYHPKARIVTHKLYNSSIGKLRSPRPVETRRGLIATEERKLKRWLMPI